MRIKTKLLGAVLGMALLTAGPAYAQQLNPTQDAYSKPAGSVQQQVSNGDNSSKSEPAQKVETRDDSLPFTGLTLGIMLAAGIALVGTGLVVRRVARPAETA